MEKNYLKIEKIELWVRVGVLEEERKYGQKFNLDILLWMDFDECSRKDDLSKTIDYSKLIREIKFHSKFYSCLTIEKYSQEIQKIIQDKFNPERGQITLTKCNPPIKGFSGNVSIVRIFER